MSYAIESEVDYVRALEEYDFLSSRPADRDLLARLSEIEEAVEEWEEKTIARLAPGKG